MSENRRFFPSGRDGQVIAPALFLLLAETATHVSACPDCAGHRGKKGASAITGISLTKFRTLSAQSYLAGDKRPLSYTFI